MPRIATLSSIPTLYNPNLAPPYPAFGQVLYETPGTFQWTCPAGVTSISVVCIGGGGCGPLTYTSNISASGGGGGGLGYRNNYTVIPGNTYTVVVGAGGNVGTLSGTNSYFNTTTTVRGGGGGGGASGYRVTLLGGVGGSYTGTGGASGGRGGSLYHSVSVPLNGGNHGGGGGAGGYTTAGGAGGGVSVPYVESYRNGIGSSTGGGGGAWAFFNGSTGNHGYAGSGGGTGVLGLGGSASAGGVWSSTSSSGEPYRNGEQYNSSLWTTYSSTYGGYVDGTGTNFVQRIQRYGGGGPGGTNTAPRGSSGAVRIMWPGHVRAYPNTRVADETTIATI